jgi:lipopolysaccharide export system permease protein
MKLIDRYIGRQIIFTALFGVAVLTSVLVLGNLFKLLDVLFNHNVPLEIVLSIIAYILPFSLTFTIPWGFLTAVLLVFGRLSAENELIALKSSGLSITRLCASLFCLSLVCVGICLWIDLDVAPRAQSNMKSAVVKLATQNPLALFDSDHVIDEFPGKKIYVEDKNGRELKNILVYEMDKNSSVLRVIFAKKGELETNSEAVLLHIYDARLEQRDPDSPNDLDNIREGIEMKESVFAIPLKELYEKNKLQLGPSQAMPGELWREMRELKAGPQNAANRSKLSSIRTEINKRFSFSLASFALALIAVPLAITAHRKETSIGFLFSFIVAFGYFFFSQLATMAQNNPNLHPELLIWLPNIVFIIFGSFLFWKLSKQ